MEPLLLPDPVLLDLDEEVPVTQDGPILIGGLRSCLLVALAETLEHLPTQAGRCADEPLAVLCQQLLVDPRLVVVALEVPGGRQGQQVPIPHVVLGQQDHVVVVGVCFAFLVGHAARGDVGLDPDDRLDPRLLGRGVERDDPVHAPVVGQRQRRHPLLGHPLRHLADAAQPVEQAELRVDVEVDEAVAGARVRGSLGHGSMLPEWRDSERSHPRARGPSQARDAGISRDWPALTSASAVAIAAQCVADGCCRRSTPVRSARAASGSEEIQGSRR